MLKIATFNVNSVKARLPRLLEWLKTSNPDIVCLQELKCEENAFPFEALLDAGYNSAVYGQKTYNGVAILSKYKTLLIAFIPLAHCLIFIINPILLSGTVGFVVILELLVYIPK